MKSHHYLAIIVRLFSIALFVYGIRQMGFLIEVVLTGMASEIRYSILFAASTAAIPLLISILLWVCPVTISKSIIPPEANLEIQPVNVQNLLTILIIAIGLYVFYFALTDSIYWAIVYKATQLGTYNGAEIGLAEENKANMIVTVIQLCVSLAFIAKAKSFAFQLLRFAR